MVVTHPNGYTNKFENITKFWGHHGKKAGGELAKINQKRDSILLPEEFSVETVQVPEDKGLVFSSAVNTIERDLKRVGVRSYKTYIGNGESFRVGLSTLMKYKGNRDDLVKPVLINEITEFLTNRYKAEIITDFEVDDIVIMDAYKDINKVVISSDKDSFGCDVLVYNPDRPDEGVIDCRGFGSLYKDAKGKIRGTGRLFFYWQVCYGDVVDNYKSNCFSNIKWGEVSAYNVLKDCKNDKQAFTAMKTVFKHLYPEPKTIIGWRGDEILIDWKYVYAEMFHMARMWRHKDDHVDPLEVMERMTGSLD